MPLVFRGTCSHCGYESPTVTAGGLAVFVTDRDEDARRRAGEAVPVVTHPFAPFVLEEFGLSFHATAWGGQLVDVQNLVCRDCGRVSAYRRLTAGGVTIGCGGCTGVAALSLVVGVAAGLLVANPFVGAGLGVALCVLLATGLEFGATRLVRWRFPERAAAVDTPRGCGHCGSSNCVPVGTRGGGPFPCPQCGESAVRMVPIARPG